jgi:cell filamentation protein
MFIEHLAASLGYQLDFMKISSTEMLETSVKTFVLDYKMMEELMLKALSTPDAT